MIFRSFNFIVLLAVFGLTACAKSYPDRMDYNQSEQQEFVENPVEPVVQKGMSNEEIFSNPNVIVYPVTGDLSQSNRAFAKYRGVVENTTAGGYTVFDPSVTVYALEGQGMKPAYLPEYSVPRYAQNYRSPVGQMPNDTVFPPLPLMYQDDPYVPDSMSMQPRVPSMTKSSPVADNMNELPVRNIEQRRSRPVLTGYD
jgi:hypothetical protein